MARKHSMLLRWHSITLKTSHHAHPSHIRHCSLLSTCSWSNHQSCTQWNLQSTNNPLKAPQKPVNNSWIISTYILLPPFAFTHDMVLSLVSDAGYLVLPNARARCATLNKLSNHPTSNPPIINLMDLLTSSSRNPWRPIFWSRRWDWWYLSWCTGMCAHPSHLYWIWSPTT